MNKTFVRIICIVLAVLMALSVIVVAIGSYAYAAPTREDLKKLNNQYADIKQRLNELDSKINDYEFDEQVATARKEILDEKVGLIMQEISNLEEQIDTYTQLIADKELEIARLQEQQDIQWELYKTRIRAMEENGAVTYYAILFGASDFSDLLFRLDAIESIMEYDEGVYEKLLAAEKATRNAKDELNDTKLEMENTIVEKEAAEAELQLQIEEANKLIEELEKNIEEYKAYYQETEDERARLYKEIVQMENDIKKAEEEAKRVKGTGVFQWPAGKAGHITSKFGWRYHPILKVNKYHEGIDIGGLGYGCDVYAADGGTVITSALSDTYGNYIVISHGNGYTTLYAHLSQRLVSKGDTVKKGALIGYVGSTGRSNGPHLHFEIWVNGERTDPLKYFSGVKVDADA